VGFCFALVERQGVFSAGFARVCDYPAFSRDSLPKSRDTLYSHARPSDAPFRPQALGRLSVSRGLGYRGVALAQSVATYRGWIRRGKATAKRTLHVMTGRGPPSPSRRKDRRPGAVLKRDCAGRVAKTPCAVVKPTVTASTYSSTAAETVSLSRRLMTLNGIPTDTCCRSASASRSLKVTCTVPLASCQITSF
jgi:hypothetical protein